MPLYRFLFLITLLLSACVPAATATPLPPSATPLPVATETATALPSATATQTQQPSATATQTQTASPSASPTPAAAFNQASVLSITNSVGGFQITLKVPGIQGKYDLQMGDNRYACAGDPAVPDRLFCTGLNAPPKDTDLSIVFRLPGTQTVMYSGRLTIPSLALATAMPKGYAETWCADRGTNVRCETECRIAPDGNPCIVATCTDACGPYFAVHTCPDMDLNFASCSPEQWAQLKALYSIP